MPIIMWNSRSSASRRLFRWATMLLQVTPAAVTSPVMTLGTRITNQLTFTPAPYSCRISGTATVFAWFSVVMHRTWDPSLAGTLTLLSGRVVRGRGLHRAAAQDQPPEFAVYLLGTRPAPVDWEMRWVRWPDFRLPVDRLDLRDALQEAWRRAASERVEVACAGGRGRTGTALACLAILDGVPPREAVAFVRAHYDGRAVETFRQRRFVRSFSDR
jgi:hypothetical protein